MSPTPHCPLEWKRYFADLAQVKGLGWVIFVGSVLSSIALGDVKKSDATRVLRERGKLGISFDECALVESQLGQLFYVNVDGVQAPGEQAIHPQYVSLVQDLQLGGVLPHFRGENLQQYREATRALQSVSDEPLLIGVDYLYLMKNRLGLGYGGGYLQDHARDEERCFRDRAYLEAVLHRQTGVNQTLGPTVEQNPKFSFLNQPASTIEPYARELIRAYQDQGVAATQKHFPYTPWSFDLHRKNADTKLDSKTVSGMLEIFRKLSGKTDFVMTTHIYNSEVDPDDLATFSDRWIRILREDIGFQGLILSDALFMIDRYPETIAAMKAKWKLNSEVRTIFAARAILSGHDLVFLEGNAAETRRVFHDVHELACQKNELGESLRKRVFESYARIRQYKQKQKNELRAKPYATEAQLQQVMDELNRPGCPDSRVVETEIRPVLQRGQVPLRTVFPSRPLSQRNSCLLSGGESSEESFQKIRDLYFDFNEIDDHMNPPSESFPEEN